MEQEVLQNMVAENRVLETKLTKRNEQYIFDLKKYLTAANASEEQKVVALHEVLPQLIDGQKKGQTARQLFGPVSEKATELLNKPIQQKQAKVWEMWIDNSLLIFMLLAIISGISPLITNQPVPYGISALILSALSGGYVFYMMYKYIHQYDRPGADRSKKPGFWKSIGIMILIFLAWFAVIMITSFIPTSINPHLDPLINIILGLLAFALRSWLRKKYDIQGSLLIR